MKGSVMTEAATLDESGTAPRLVLASASAARATMLRNAGLRFDCQPARIDEDSVKESLRADGATAEQLADTLAEMKAVKISTRLAADSPGAMVLGADQVLVCDGVWYDKPADRAAAADHLRSLRDRSHRLVSAAVLVHDGTRIWGATEHATLRMRPFSDAFLERYLDAAGPEVTLSVGAYRLEGLGAQLFSRIDGDYFTILGLPLLRLLDFLRSSRMIPA